MGIYPVSLFFCDNKKSFWWRINLTFVLLFQVSFHCCAQSCNGLPTTASSCSGCFSPNGHKGQQWVHCSPENDWFLLYRKGLTREKTSWMTTIWLFWQTYVCLTAQPGLKSRAQPLPWAFYGTISMEQYLWFANSLQLTLTKLTQLIQKLSHLTQCREQYYMSKKKKKTVQTINPFDFGNYMPFHLAQP